jgi:hypothetical protein
LSLACAIERATAARDGYARACFRFEVVFFRAAGAAFTLARFAGLVRDALLRAELRAGVARAFGRAILDAGRFGATAARRGCFEATP